MRLQHRLNTRRWAMTAGLLLLAGCARNPVTGNRQLALISESQEIAIGEASHPEVLREFGAVENKALQDYFSRIGMEMAKLSHRPNLPWHFTVLDSPVVNAFAVPGGYIYFTRGILAAMNNEAELAGVLGHEIGHVTARHSVTQISQQQLLGLGMGVGSILSPAFRQMSDLAGTGLGIFMLKNSRDHERQSDQLGVQYMALSGYDPEQLSRFFQVFVDMRQQEGGAIPNWLSSHPAPPDRIQATETEALQVKSEYPQRQYKINRDGFLSMLDGLVYGENPREGFTDGGRFAHPDLRFQLDVPQGWKVENTKSAVIMAEPQGNAVLQLSLVPPEEGQSPEAIGRKIGSQQGIEMVAGSATSINGNTAFLGRYRLQTDSGYLGVQAAFIRYGGNVYQIAGLAPESAFSGFERIFDSNLRSFRELTDSRLLNVQPDRIQIYRTRGNQSLRGVAGSTAQGRITLEELTRLNRIDPDQTLEPGTVIKLVRAGR
jgi:predicted Zn-dependent protease